VTIHSLRKKNLSIRVACQQTLSGLRTRRVLCSQANFFDFGTTRVPAELERMQLLRIFVAAAFAVFSGVLGFSPNLPHGVLWTGTGDRSNSGLSYVAQFPNNTGSAPTPIWRIQLGDSSVAVVCKQPEIHLKFPCFCCCCCCCLLL
jgi:hypothetical protein